jgi:hypothetical protein
MPKPPKELVSILDSRVRAPLPTQSPFDWVCENVVFAEPQVKGKFNPCGREYLREVIDNINRDDVHDETLCFGTGNGKTTSTMAKVAWALEFEPFRGLWVMPTKEGEGGAREFNKTRFLEMIKAMDCFKSKLPANRHKMKGLQVNFGGNVIGFVGSNSPSQVGANRCRIVIQDEKDKFKAELNREAGAGYLANERTKGVPNSKRNGTSTPTREDGPIWIDLLASDLRRRFLPCPHCNSNAKPANDFKGWFILVQSEQYTVLPTKMPDGRIIPLASLRWDTDAKRLSDNSWDMDRVIRSARFECPHCGGHVRDEHRLWLDKNGQWIPTRNAMFHRGYHLPSFYAPCVDFDSTWGGMAKKFLDCHESGEGMRGYINSDLAEVDASQEHNRTAIEIKTQAISQDDWCPLMTVDVQKKWPYLWFVVRKWSAFKLLPSFKLLDGKPEFAAQLNDGLKSSCKVLLNNSEKEVWPILSEIFRFDTRTGNFPMLAWLIEKKITGKALVELWVKCEKNTLDFGKFIYREMGLRMPKGGDSEAVAVGHCETDDWAELREIAQQYNVGRGLTIPNLAVLIDSGYREQSNPEVLRKCFETAKQFVFYEPVAKKFFANPIHARCKACPVDAWQPFKGYPITRRWNVGGIAREWHHNVADPFDGSSEADKCVIQVLEAASDLFWNRMQDLRERQTEEYIQRGGNVWQVAPNVGLHPADKFKPGDYQKQMDARYRDRDGNICERGSGGGGKRRWPDHLNDCERMQFPLAMSLGFFDYETSTKEK